MLSYCFRHFSGRFWVTLFAVPAFACSAFQVAQAADPVGDRFVALDANHDGQVCWEEFYAVNPNISRQGFDSIDKDKSGGIGQEEWRIFYANHGMGVSGGSKSMTMPGRPAMPPVVTPPSGPGVSAPAAASPVEPGKPDIPGASAPKPGAAPVAPAAPVQGKGGKSGVPLVMPPAEVKTPAPTQPTMPLVTPPKAPEKVTPAKGTRHEEN